MVLQERIIFLVTFFVSLWPRVAKLGFHHFPSEQKIVVTASDSRAQVTETADV